MVGLGQKFLLVSRAQVHARALVLVPGVPVRALARLAAKSRDTFTQLEAVAAAAIGERRRRVRSGFAAHRARPLPDHIRANCAPSVFRPQDCCRAISEVVASFFLLLREEIDADGVCVTTFEHLRQSRRHGRMTPFRHQQAISTVAPFNGQGPGPGPRASTCIHGLNVCSGILAEF